MAEYFGNHSQGEDQLPRFRELRREHANIRAALDYALALPGQDRYAARIATSLYEYWQISGRLSEGRYWLGKILDRFPGPSAERAWALVVHGNLGSWLGEVADAIADLQEAVPMATELGEDLACARGYLYLNLALTLAGRHAEAATAGAVASERAYAIGDVGGLIALDSQMSYLHLLGGNLDQIITLAVNGSDELRPTTPGTASGGQQAPGPLTSREHEIAVLVAAGQSNREIAERLVISKRTVDAHLEHILAKLGASSRVQIANWMRSRQQPSG